MKRGPLVLVLIVAAALAGIFLFRDSAGNPGGDRGSPIHGSLSEGDVQDAVADPRASIDSGAASGATGAAGQLGAAAPSSLPLLALDGEGLRLFDAETGSSRPLPFESEGSFIRSTLGTVLSEDPVEEGFSPDCAATYIRWSEGLTIWVVRDRFVGWSLRDEAARMTTPAGIGIGSTRAELEDAYAAEVFTSSIGVEFSAGGLAGVLESSADDGRITHLWAGQTCIAR